VKRLGRYVAFVGAALCVAAPARAQELNRQAFPVGEDAVGLGGAYTGRAVDASATFYNPGGLVFGYTGSVSIGLALSLSSEYEVGDASGDTALEYEDAFGLPFYAGGAVQLGDEGEGRHALAFATLTPNHDRRRVSFTLDGGGASELLRVQRRDRQRWYGVSYAYRLTDWLGVGISAFIAIRNFEHREEEIRVDSTLRARASEVDYESELLVLRIGGLVRPIDELSLGLMFQPPGIVIGARGSATALRGEPATSERLVDDVGASSPLPWQLRAGASWEPERWLLFTADVILQGALGSRGDPVRRLALDVAPGLLGSYYANDYWGDYTVDFALGGRGVVEDTVPISAGFFTSFSSAPPIEEIDTYRPDRVDIFGGSLSVGFVNADVDIAIGVVAAFGVGSGLRAATFDSLGPPTYEVAHVRSQTIYIFLSGAGGAAEAIGRSVADELDLMEDDEEDGEDEAGISGRSSVPGSRASGPSR